MLRKEALEVIPEVSDLQKGPAEAVCQLLSFYLNIQGKTQAKYVFVIRLRLLNIHPPPHLVLFEQVMLKNGEIYTFINPYIRKKVYFSGGQFSEVTEIIIDVESSYNEYV